VLKHLAAVVMPVHEVDPHSIILLLIACLGMPGILATAYDYDTHCGARLGNPLLKISKGMLCLRVNFETVTNPIAVRAIGHIWEVITYVSSGNAIGYKP